jgi:hypothetical protein
MYIVFSDWYIELNTIKNVRFTVFSVLLPNKPFFLLQNPVQKLTTVHLILLAQVIFEKEEVDSIKSSGDTGE